MKKQTPMTDPFRISAKALGEVALPAFCPRCFWLKTHVKLPYQIFPGIFSSIDAYTKRAVHSWFDSKGSAPAWLSGLGDVVGYAPAPHYSKFNILDSETNTLFTGAPDDILVLRDGSHVIVVYKTAKYTGAQDLLFPLCETQLNGYALISEQRGPQPVSALALIYMEPVTYQEAAQADENHRGDGFAMGFAANIHAVDLNPGMVRPLITQARAIYDAKTPPARRAGCNDCQLVDELIAAAQST